MVERTEGEAQALSVTLEEPYQCKLCGERFARSVTQCTSCGSTSIRDVVATGGEYDVVSEDAVRHLKRKIEFCWNEKKAGNNYIKHKFVKKLVKVVNLSTTEIHEQLRCGTCNRFYASYNGRAATPEEMEKARAGKIESVRTQV